MIHVSACAWCVSRRPDHEQEGPMGCYVRWLVSLSSSSRVMAVGQRAGFHHSSVLHCVPASASTCASLHEPEAQTLTTSQRITLGPFKRTTE